MAQAIIIDLYDTLTDESDNERNAIALLRQIVATAGVRVSEQALKEAEAHSIESFAPRHHHGPALHQRVPQKLPARGEDTA